MEKKNDSPIIQEGAIKAIQYQTKSRSSIRQHESSHNKEAEMVFSPRSNNGDKTLELKMEEKMDKQAV